MAWRCRFLAARLSQRHHRWLISAGTYDENGDWQGEQKEYKEVEKIVHKEVIKEVTVGVSEEELSKVHAEAERKKEEIRERVLTRRRRT